MFRVLFHVLARPFGETQEEGHSFRARSAARDGETDRRRAASVMAALEATIKETEDERSGLKRRVDDALARAAVTLGNDSDEYLERELLDDRHQSLFSLQISNGERRLVELNEMLSHLNFLKTTARTRFAQFVPSSK